MQVWDHHLLVLWCAFVMQMLIVVMEASIRPSLLSAIMCTVYQVSVCSSSPGGDKSTAQNSSVEGWGTFSNFILVVEHYFLFLLESSMYWGVSILQEYSVTYAWISKSVLCFSFCYLFFWHIISVCQGTLWKLYAQNHVASCNPKKCGCSHQSNDTEINCSFNFLITHLG